MGQSPNYDPQKLEKQQASSKLYLRKHASIVTVKCNYKSKQSVSVCAHVVCMYVLTSGNPVADHFTLLRLGLS